MTEKDQLLINELKSYIRRLIDSLERTKSELERVQTENEGLHSKLRELDYTHKALEVRYENLKVAKVLAEGDTDNQAAKQKINRIIREVDKCIALLNK
jgi:predicted  nucleic acid-binding Zn-ribbon protein